MAKASKKIIFGDEVSMISSEFNRSMISLISDFLEIAPEKVQEIKELREPNIKVKDKVKEQSEALIHVRNYMDKSTRYSQFKYAMFNYMNSIFERSINNLLKLAISSNKDIRKIYIQKFIEYDKQLSEKNAKTIRDANYECASDKEKLKIQLNYFDQIISLKPDNWQFLLNIPNEVLWSDKKLKFQFTELRARRHLLTHRGPIYDNKYIDEIKYSVLKSKNTDDPKEIFKILFNKGYFANPKKNLDSIDKLAGKNEIFVSMVRDYFCDCFCILSRLFHMILRYVANPEHDYTSRLQIEFLTIGSKYNIPIFHDLVRTLTTDLIKIKKDKDNLTEKCNYLISCIETREITKESYLKQEYEDDFVREIEGNEDPLLKFLIAYYNGQNRKYKQFIEQIEDESLPFDALTWPIFRKVIHSKSLLKILKTKIYQLRPRAKSKE